MAYVRTYNIFMKDIVKKENNLTNNFQCLYKIYFLICLSLMILYIFLVGVYPLSYVPQ